MYNPVVAQEIYNIRALGAVSKLPIPQEYP